LIRSVPEKFYSSKIFSTENKMANQNVEVSAELMGGKMHGGLARCGKVRKNTPNKEKKERLQKPLVGRAKRRAQYNKRFVTVVSGFGKKRSPNSNQ